jgi:hypothetical protein
MEHFFQKRSNQRAEADVFSPTGKKGVVFSPTGKTVLVCCSPADQHFYYLQHCNYYAVSLYCTAVKYLYETAARSPTKH